MTRFAKRTGGRHGKGAKMPKIEILGLPELTFAHVFSAPTYDNVIPIRTGHLEISYVVEGTIRFEDGDGFGIRRQYEVICNFSNSERRVTSDNFHEHHTVCFKLPYRETQSGENVLTVPSSICFVEYGEVHRLIDGIIHCYTLYPNRKNLISGMILQLLDEINEASLTSDGRRRDTASLYVYKAKEYIYKNLTRPLTQREIAERLNITPEYFSSIFKAACGESPMRFINKIKLSRIRMLMARENLRLYEAAERFGYTDPNYVSKLYKKLYGQNITDSITVKFSESEIQVGGGAKKRGARRDDI